MAIGSPPFSIRDVWIELGEDPFTVPYSLADCFTNAISINFDPAYSGAKDRLSNFTNYGAPPACASTTLITGTLKYSASSNDCSTHFSVIPARYSTTGATLQATSDIYTDTVCTPAVSGYYSDGSIWKYWDSTTETFTSNGFCI